MDKQKVREIALETYNKAVVNGMQDNPRNWHTWKRAFDECSRELVKNIIVLDDVSGCVLPSEEESDQEAYRRHSPTKHVIDYDMGCYRGWQECYNWIEEKLSNR